MFSLLWFLSNTFGSYYSCTECTTEGYSNSLVLINMLCIERQCLLFFVSAMAWDRFFRLFREYMLQYLRVIQQPQKRKVLSLPLQDVNHLEDFRYTSVMHSASLLAPTPSPKLQLKRLSMLFFTFIQYIMRPSSFLNTLLLCK